MEAADRVFSGYKPLLTGCEDASDVGTTQSIPQFMPDDIVSLCGLVKDLLIEVPMLIRVRGSFIVVGDLHGNFLDLIRILRMFGLPPVARYIFLGDYVDRGDYSVEVITLLFALYVKYPEDIILLRGNHEVNEICASYGFKAAIEEQFGNVGMFHIFVDAFNYLSLAAVLNDTVFLVHGGISQHLMHLEQISAYQKPLMNDDDHLIKDLLWSDPSTLFPMFAESSRGEMNTYGKQALCNFLDSNKLKMMIRAHQFMEKGAESLWSRKLCTVFSSSSYKFQGSNEAAVLKVSEKVFSCHRLAAIPKLPRDQCSFFTMKMGIIRQSSILCLLQKTSNALVGFQRTGSSLNMGVKSGRKGPLGGLAMHTGSRLIQGIPRKKIVLRDPEAFAEDLE